MRLSFGDCVFDVDTREVLRGGRPVAISPKAFALLELLASSRPAAVSKADIHASLWPGIHVSDANLPNLIAELRAALGDDAERPRIIRTVPRFGYAFSANARPERTRAVDWPGKPASHYRLIWGQREIALEPGDNLIGRDQEAVVWIDDESVSRRHARVTISPEGATIEDLGSKNGTFVNGRRISGPQRLAEGDDVQFGSPAARFRFGVAGDITRTAEVPI
jgi:DNA-binding winged helix-turn-helix (wHTH) protein